MLRKDLELKEIKDLEKELYRTDDGTSRYSIYDLTKNIKNFTLVTFAKPDLKIFGKVKSICRKSIGPRITDINLLFFSLFQTAA